jgi:DNA-binding transcriptional LysR family regulator
MKLTLAQLESFHWIAQLGSFGAAAEHLHLSQPAISVRLAGLERAVGKPLFKRQGRRMRLTPAGVALVEQAAHMLSLANGMVSEPAALDPLQFRLRIGAPDSFALVCLPQLLETFEHEYPRLKVALTIENSSVLAQSLNDGDLDIVSWPSRRSMQTCAPSTWAACGSTGWPARDSGFRAAARARRNWRNIRSSPIRIRPSSMR